ncbi:hypothetical protein AB0O22_09415 [Streptomyces sp. NPDC091204]|uniref:hypothetical protein n=1 Tax=Streptomyces sp. NPDC091204 TaxID=3155299 RepID=UPI0034136E80
MTDEKPRLIPNGKCWCGCGKDANIGKFFAQGHDKVAEAALMAVQYEASVPRLLAEHGYGPDNSVRDAALTQGGWRYCDYGCGYAAAPSSIRNHVRKYHEQGNVTMGDDSTQRGSLEHSIRTLGGLWDTTRGVTVLRDAGYAPDEKYVRETYRRLAEAGLLVKVQDRPVQYRVIE